MGRRPAFGRRRRGELQGWLAAARGIGPILVAAPLAVFTGVFLIGGPPESSGAPAASVTDWESALANAPSEEELRRRRWPTSAEALDAAQPDLSAPKPARAATEPDREAARFGYCSGPARFNCVVDGDTFWYRGAKIRIADINTPEVSKPGCAYEAELGARATRRLHALLNAGPFSLRSVDRDRDRYGRLLRTVTRGGESLGEVLVAEGMAERWKGYRRNWC